MKPLPFVNRTTEAQLFGSAVRFQQAASERLCSPTAVFIAEHQLILVWPPGLCETALSRIVFPVRLSWLIIPSLCSQPIHSKAMFYASASPHNNPLYQHPLQKSLLAASPPLRGEHDEAPAPTHAHIPSLPIVTAEALLNCTAKDKRDQRCRVTTMTSQVSWDVAMKRTLKTPPTPS